ncbi:uncharacterized protein [Scyliorhinus torazame]|uniref:uncharacterized protein isoform X2 n=1 Tax=Scyliorhinus torazame TaxID=75743 RepID=UPI003B58FDA2
MAEAVLIELLPKLLISFQPKVAAGDFKLENTEIVIDGVRRGGFKVQKLKPSITSGSDRVLNLSYPEYQRNIIEHGRKKHHSQCGETVHVLCVWTRIQSIIRPHKP